MKKYTEYKGLNLPEIDKEISAFWEAQKVFDQSMDNRKDAPTYVFYEGPPSANGKPGIHHVMARTVKDLFCRYHTMKGKLVERKGGWDTHGLPIELNVEKELGITKEDIGTKITVDEYNAKCRETVMRYKDMWDDITRKMGYWVDLDNPYITFENEYIESVWSLLKKLYDKDYLYKGYTIQPYSPAAGTGLSTHELNQPGCYRDVTDTSAVAQFRVVRGEQSEFLFDSDGEDVCFIAWTTTPWTLPSNTALTVGKKIDYVKVRTYNPYTSERVSVILAKDLIKKWFKEGADELDFDAYKKGDKKIPYRIAGEFKGAELLDIRYEQLLPYAQPEDGDAFCVLHGDFVTTSDGTGIVHTAPSFGADDMFVGKKNGIGSLTLVDRQGKFKDNVGEFSGRYVKNYKDEPKDTYRSVDVDIAIKLKTENKAFNVQKYAHNYPHCWRTDKPVLYYPLDSWFVATTKAKDRMVELNKTINWKPAATGEKRFGNWLENLQDWNLSRSRFWGIPLPIWRAYNYNTEKTDEICIGSIEDLLKNKGYYFDNKRFYNDINNSSSELFRTVKLMADSLPKEVTEGIQFSPPLDIEGLSEKPLRLEEVLSVFYGYRRGGHLNDFEFEFRKFLFDKKYIRELQKEDLKDIHRPYIDNVCFLSDDGEYRIFVRELDLIDVWFDSGSMPYAQWHYPNVEKEHFNPDKEVGELVGFPADFISEGVDQTRGWFFTLHAIAVMCFDSVAYKNVVSTGLLLAKDGVKMSKRLGNVIEPFAAIEGTGADPIRWYMMSNAAPWDNLKYDPAGVDEVRRKFFGTLYNTYSFYALYANVDSFYNEEKIVPVADRPEIDRWVMSLLNTLVKEVDAEYADYEPSRATRKVMSFVDEHLSNWYVRLCRRRFWKGEKNTDKIAAYQTLYECLVTVSKLMAPVAPFFAEFIYKNLNDTTQNEAFSSVHLADFPTVNEAIIDKDLEERMSYAQRISSLVLSLRKREKIRVRQPLTKVLLPVLNDDFRTQVEGVKDLILSEVNVKDIEYITDTSGIITKKIKPNFKTLGRKLGKNMKAAAAAINEFDQADIAKIEQSGGHDLAVDGATVALTLEDFIITSDDIEGWLVANDGALTVALDVTLTDELKAEGIARELVNRIQNIRKSRDFNVTDRISVKLQKHEAIVPAVEQFGDYIRAEVLANSLELADSVDGEEVELLDGVVVGVLVEN